MERFAVLVVITGFTLASVGTAVGQSAVYIYPQRGQSAALQARDQAECERWAMEQTGSYPTAPQARTPVPGQAGVPGGTGIESAATGGGMKGAAEGALKGATEGALKGLTGGSPVGTAAAGTLTGTPGGAAALGTAAASSALGGAGMAGNQPPAQQPQALQQNYQRAYAACMEGRGYTVK